MIKYVLLAVSVFFLVSTAEANILFNGKSSDLFKEASAEIKDKDILKEVVEKVKKDKEIIYIMAFVQSTFKKSKDEKSAQLGEERFEALKGYLKEQLPHLEVMGAGASLPENKGTNSQNEDLLSIQAGYMDGFGNMRGLGQGNMQSPEEMMKKLGVQKE